MRWLIKIVLTIGLLWSGYWFIGATALERGGTAWLEERRADGWVAEAASVQTIGYPTAFRTVLSDLTLADPETGVAWTVPAFTVEAPTYAPNRISAILPPEQTLASPLERLTLRADTLRADVAFVPDTALTLESSQATASDLSIMSNDGWVVALGSAQAITRQTENDPLAHRIVADITGFTPDPQFKASIDPGELLPNAVDTLTLDATVAFDAPCDRYAVEEARPQPTRLDLALIRGKWGALDLRAAGTLDIDASGIASGRVDVKAENWREMLDIAVATELLPRDLAPTIENALEVLAGLSGNPNSIDVPLSFQNGFYSLGPLPLGPAPRFRIR